MAAMRSTARSVPTNGTPADVGGGYLDAAAALASVSPRPGAASVVGMANGNGRITVTWTAAPASPKFPVTGYVVTPVLGGVPQTPQTFNSAATSEVVTGLTNGAAYTFTVAALDANGPGPASAPSAAIVVGQPGEPPSVTVVAGNARATVAWTKPVATFGLPIVGYDVFVYAVHGGNRALVATHHFTSVATTQTITGLTNGSTYTFAVAADNSFASGVTSLMSASITAGTPAAPGGVSALPGNGTATVRWTRPASSGFNLTGYSISVIHNGSLVGTRPAGGGVTSTTISGLALGGHYTFRVAARDQWGTGSLSNASASITVGAPRAPVGVTATSGHKSAKVHWSAPAADGNAVTSYRVTPYIGSAAKPAQVFNSAATTETVTGLVSGQHYSFRVAATNARGTGPVSSASNVVPVT